MLSYVAAGVGWVLSWPNANLLVGVTLVLVNPLFSFKLTDTQH